MIPNVPINREVFFCVVGDGQIIGVNLSGFPKVGVTAGSSTDFLSAEMNIEFPGLNCYGDTNFGCVNFSLVSIFTPSPLRLSTSGLIPITIAATPTFITAATAVNQASPHVRCQRRREEHRVLHAARGEPGVLLRQPFGRIRADREYLGSSERPNAVGQLLPRHSDYQDPSVSGPVFTRRHGVRRGSTEKTKNFFSVVSPRSLCLRVNTDPRLLSRFPAQNQSGGPYARC